VLICDDDGQVLEAGWANLWLLEEDRLRTAPADGRILPGVTRARLLALGPSMGLEASESPITWGDLQTAPAVFLTSSLRIVVVTSCTRPSAPADGRIDAIADALAAGDWS
jgi:para-aminobenzoate synthetase/4-amino-4-deoxychorismate lyase